MLSLTTLCLRISRGERGWFFVEMHEDMDYTCCYDTTWRYYEHIAISCSKLRFTNQTRFTFSFSGDVADERQEMLTSAKHPLNDILCYLHSTSLDADMLDSEFVCLFRVLGSGSGGAQRRVTYCCLPFASSMRLTFTHGKTQLLTALTSDRRIGEGNLSRTREALGIYAL